MDRSEDQISSVQARPDHPNAPGSIGKWGDRRGFTMVELIVVLFIISVAATMVAPRMDLAGSRLRQSVAETQSVLIRAQRNAVILQHDIVIRFSPDDGGILVHRDVNNDGLVSGGELTQMHILAPSIAFGKTGVPTLSWGAGPIGFDQDRVTFHRDGSASAQGGLYLSSIRQLSEGGHPQETVGLEVVRATGSVRCLKYGIQGWAEGC